LSRSCAAGRRAALREGRKINIVSERRQDMLALEPRLIEAAEALTRNAVEARALVVETLAAAEELDYGASDPSSAQGWIFRLLRQRFHSVERERDYRRSRSALVTQMGEARKKALRIAALGQ
jgi:DNA-directed RNA polymerase specialized sigma24 family protein